MGVNNMQSNHRLSRRLLHDQVSQYIKESILHGVLQPGDRIVETQIAHQLGVSQAPVREAIRQLEFSGLIEQIPYCGTYVKKVTVEEIENFYQVRGALEILAVRQAAHFITPSQLEQVEQALFLMEEAARRQDVEQYVRYDAQFHDLIIEASGNDLLCRLWEQCHIKQWLFIGTSLANRNLQFLAARHRTILDRLKVCDVDGLQRAVEEHLSQLLSIMKAQKASGD